MEIPRYTPAQRPSLDLPEIYIQSSTPSDPYRQSSRSNSYSSRVSPPTSSRPMSIPKSREPPPPPPLPPPKFTHLEHAEDSGESDIAWQWENSRQERSWGKHSPSVPPGSSLYGSFGSSGKSIVEGRPDYNRRGSSASTITSISGVSIQRDAYPQRIDEGYASLSGTSIGSNLLVLPSVMLVSNGSTSRCNSTRISKYCDVFKSV